MWIYVNSKSDRNRVGWQMIRYLLLLISFPYCMCFLCLWFSGVCCLWGTCELLYILYVQFIQAPVDLRWTDCHWIYRAHYCFQRTNIFSFSWLLHLSSSITHFCMITPGNQTEVRQVSGVFLFYFLLLK